MKMPDGEGRCPSADRADADGDAVGNVCDNCPATANSDQTDAAQRPTPARKTWTGTVSATPATTVATTLLAQVRHVTALLPLPPAAAP